MRPFAIRSTRVILPAGIRPATVHVADGRIAGVAAHDAAVPSGLDVDDVGGLVVMPGLVDTHVHLNDPGRAEWEGFDTGTAAAAAGGITTVVDMPLNSIPATTTLAGLDAKRQAARGRVRVDVGFWGGVVPGNVDALAPLCDAGVCGFKCFLVPSGVDEFPPVDERDLRSALPVLAPHRIPLLVHAEVPGPLVPIETTADRTRYLTWLESRPPRAEVDAIRLMVSLCREFRTPVHIVHLATVEAVPLLREARAEGLPITVETCPHYLTFCAEDIPDGATVYKCAPPLRDRATRDGLWRALEDGVIDFVASDHSPSPPAMKPAGDFPAAWGGIASLELGLAAVWTGMLQRGVALDRIAEWLSARPARLAGLADRKGAIAERLDADLTVWDPDATFMVDAMRLEQRHKQTPYAGCELRGRVRRTYVRGRLVYRDGAVLAAQPPGGQLLARAR
jgi:allantoinase